MEILVIILTISVLALLGFQIYQFKQAKAPEGEGKLIFDYIESLRKDVRESHFENRKETQAKLDKIDERIAKGLDNSHQTLQKQHSESARMIKEITEELTNVKQTNKQVLNFSEQLQSLENILKNPKQRGILGEYFLESLLGNVLAPNEYQMQYKFSNGEIVDAVVFLKDQVIPIDAKFSLEKYNKIMGEKEKIRRDELEKEFKTDVKNRIDETAKYIRQNENTTDFAFMFIPAEGIYYNLLIYKSGNINVSSVDLIEYAFKKRVIIVSPTSFYAYLQTVLHGLKALKIEESMVKIRKNAEDLHRHLNTYEVYLQKLGNSLGTTVNMYNSANKEFTKIDKDIYRMTEGESGGKIEVLILDKPLNPNENEY